MSQVKSFIKGRADSFKFAIRGIKYTLKTQPNFKVHLFAAIVVVLFGFWVKLSANQWLALVITIFSVLSSETMNTAIEEIVNMIEPQYNKVAGLIKDIAAGAVFITSVMAIVVGLIIFVPKIIALVS